MGKYMLVVSSIPPGVIREVDILSKIFGLKFVDHDIIDEKTFPEMDRKNTCVLREYQVQ
jgi:hypothetical protein